MTGSAFNKPPSDDQGSEAISGFDYQSHCAGRLCLQMLGGRDVKETICEYHEDITQVLAKNSLRFIQIKKRESVEVWTIDLLKDALAKLFKKMEFKDAGELVLCGTGRPTSKGDYPLAGLIALLDRPVDERDKDWKSATSRYKTHLSDILDSKVDRELITRGFARLRIDLTLPHPDAIKAENIQLTAQVIEQVWGVKVTNQLATKTYGVIYDAVRQGSQKPKQPRTKKRITVTEVRAMVRNTLEEGERYLAEDVKTVLDLSSKLEKGQLKRHLPYAIQRRMDARQAKFEYNISPTEWQDLKDDIATKWEAEQFQAWAANRGTRLWTDLRGMLNQIGHDWETQKQSEAFGAAFAEGIFFEMMAVCEAEIGA
jgi:hypothetical protein